MWLSVDHIVQTGGLLAIALIIFAETGLLIGFFLPGDTLLIAAGILSSQGKLPLWALIPVTAVAAILGYQVGYIIGERAGPRFFKRREGILFRIEYIERAEDFFNRHGGKTIILARFVAVVRTIVPLVAGVGKMPKKLFFTYNIIGAVLWVTSVTLAAYWLGSKIPNIDKYLIILVVLAMVFTTAGTLEEMLRTKPRRQAFKNAIKDELSFIFKRKK
jgi:membrane-associated protein